MKKIVITGAAGLVGLNLLSILHDKKLQIIAIDKNQAKVGLLKKVFPHVQAICADISMLGEWQEHIHNAHTVISLHAQISAPTSAPYFTNNVDATKNLVAVCKKNKIKHLIHMSSSVVISVSNDLYVQTKKAGEDIVHKSGIPHTIFRPPLMYGCFDYKHLGYLTALIEKTPVVPIPGSGKYIRQPLYVIDMCKILKKTIEHKPHNKVYNIIGKEKIKFIDLLKIIAKKRGLRRHFQPIPIPVFAKLLQTYALITRKAPFVKDQLYALTAGDTFPLSDWENTFGIKYTDYNDAIDQIIASKYADYRSSHIEE